MSRARTQSWIVSLALGLALCLLAGPAAHGQIYQEDSGQTVYPQKDGGLVVYGPTGGGTVTTCPAGSDTCTEVDCSEDRKTCADILSDALDGLDDEQLKSTKGRAVPVNRTLLTKLSHQAGAFSGQKVFVLQEDGALVPERDARGRHRRDVSRVVAEGGHGRDRSTIEGR